MQGLVQKTLFLSSETGNNRIVVGPWEYGIPGAALFLENSSNETTVVYVEGSTERSGNYYIGYGSDSPITLAPRCRSITVIDPEIINGKLVKFLGFRLQNALNTGFVKINLVGFGPLPECQMKRPEVGTLQSWWALR